jgi:REP element-mobilizing transposase RayT/AraC-like DNA-binding protein
MDEVDCRVFVDRLDRLICELEFTCLAWALIANHFHLVVRRNSAPLSKLMARLNGPFAQEFNRRHQRVGHLFQDRFVSRIVRDDADLQNVTRYTLFNPVKHRVVMPWELANYPWCAYGAVVGARPPLPFESVAETLRIFDESAEAARAHLDEKLEALALEVAPDAMRIESLARAACREHQLARDRIGARTTAAAVARRQICEQAVLKLGLDPLLVARVLGISRSTVHRALAREHGEQDAGV